LHGRACDEDAAFQGILRTLVHRSRQSAEQSMARRHWRAAHVHEEKCARAIRAFGFARCKRALAEQGGLLVTSNSRDGKTIGPTTETRRRAVVRGAGSHTR